MKKEDPHTSNKRRDVNFFNECSRAFPMPFPSENNYGKNNDDIFAICTVKLIFIFMENNAL